MAQACSHQHPAPPELALCWHSCTQPHPHLTQAPETQPWWGGPQVVLPLARTTEERWILAPEHQAISRLPPALICSKEDCETSNQISTAL